MIKNHLKNTFNIPGHLERSRKVTENRAVQTSTSLSLTASVIFEMPSGIVHRLCILIAALAGGFGCFLRAQTSYDTLNIKMPKHYFSTVIDLDVYGKPGRNLDSSKPIGRRLKTYALRQACVTFYTPLVTKTWKDGNVTKNTHLLLTGTFLSLRPQFDGLSRDHVLVKDGIGVRYIYNTGKKGVWFADVAPFITRDRTYDSRPYYRLASTLVYSHNSSARFNWRLGITKSFLWGNRYYLPFVGIRVGRLDRLNFSLQFPRSASVYMPLGRSVIISIYTRPQGGMFNFSNHDSLYFRKTDATFHFTRYEINTGLRLDLRATPIFNFYLSAGLSTNNNITFYSERANPRNRKTPYTNYFFATRVAPTLYLNFGFVVKFGKTRSYYNEKNLYDAMDLNRINGGNNGNVAIPLPGKKMPGDVNLESVKDLVDYSEF